MSFARRAKLAVSAGSGEASGSAATGAAQAAAVPAAAPPEGPVLPAETANFALRAKLISLRSTLAKALQQA